MKRIMPDLNSILRGWFANFKHALPWTFRLRLLDGVRPTLARTYEVISPLSPMFVRTRTASECSEPKRSVDKRRRLSMELSSLVLLFRESPFANHPET
ncbi:MAG: hypothetical protein M3461_23655 [Pseudomonadota bacterium]|nr:hypothetical protein [Pseudomonadota bacterium]